MAFEEPFSLNAPPSSFFSLLISPRPLHFFSFPVFSQESLKANTKGLMQFAAFMRDEAGERGVDALATVLPINQKAILEVILFIDCGGVWHDLSHLSHQLI